MEVHPNIKLFRELLIKTATPSVSQGFIYIAGKNRDAPTEIENLVLLSANDISAFPKWSRTVVKEEHNRDMITGGTLASPFSCKTHSLLWLFMDYPNTHAYIHTPHSPLTGNDSCSSISCYPL